MSDWKVEQEMDRQFKVLSFVLPPLCRTLVAKKFSCKAKLSNLWSIYIITIIMVMSASWKDKVVKIILYAS